MDPKKELTARMLAVGPGQPRYNILIVDDHPIFREGLTQSISRQPDLSVCGEAENAAQAEEAVRRSQPDLVVVDISLPGKSGLELVKTLQLAYPDLLVLAVSMHDESLYAGRILRAGARGYVMKQESPKTLLDAIRKVLDGGIYVSQRMSAQILESFSARSKHSSHSPIEQLSDREFEVFHLIGQAHKNEEIAVELHLSLKTVAVHQMNIRKKLNLRSKSELIQFAVRWQAAQGSVS